MSVEGEITIVATLFSLATVISKRDSAVVFLAAGVKFMVSILKEDVAVCCIAYRATNNYNII